MRRKELQSNLYGRRSAFPGVPLHEAVGLNLERGLEFHIVVAAAALRCRGGECLPGGERGIPRRRGEISFPTVVPIRRHGFVTCRQGQVLRPLLFVVVVAVVVLLFRSEHGDINGGHSNAATQKDSVRESDRCHAGIDVGFLDPSLIVAILVACSL